MDTKDTNSPHVTIIFNSPPADVLYVAARSYKSTNRDELSVEIGSVVEVLQRSDNGWWLVR